MDTFNFKRFLHTLVWQVVSQRKAYLSVAAGWLLVVLIPALLHSQVSESLLDNDTLSSVLWLVLGIYMVTCSAFIVSDISDKRSRIDSFMLPASKLEKYVSRYVNLLIIRPLTAIVGMAAGDVLQMAVSWLLGGDTTSVMCAYGNTVVDDLSDMTAMGIMLLWFAHSLYLLTGVVFRRHAWVKSSALLFGVAIALSTVFILAARYTLNTMYGSGNYYIEFIDTPWVRVLEYAGIAVVTLFNYWASYRLYARMQAVNNKWHNL